MHKISTKYLRPGMIVGQGVYHISGTFLLTKGTRLTDSYIQRLKDIGISSLYVTSSNISLGIAPPQDIIQEKTRVRAIKDIFSTFQHCQLTNTIDISLLKTTVASILDDLSVSKNNLVQLSDIRLHDNYTFSHSVNVAVLSTMLGAQLNYPKNALHDLTLGALLHDIGKINIPLQVLNKPTRLTLEEEELVRLHPEHGFKMLYQTHQFSPTMMRMTFEHHEKYDGSGYPRHLSGNEIHESARIVAIADVYDALTSERAYKKPYKPYLAYNIMLRCTAGHFDQSLLKLFFRNVAIYPIGTILKVTTGYAIVCKINLGYTRTPIVTIFADDFRRLLPTPLLIDLRKDKKFTIDYEIDEHELMILISQIKIDPTQYLIDF